MGVSTAVDDRSIGRTLPWRARTLALFLLAWAALFGVAYVIGSAARSTSHPAPAPTGSLATGTAAPAAASSSPSTTSNATVVGLSAIPATPGLKPKPVHKKPAVAHAAASTTAVTPVVSRPIYVAPRPVIRTNPTPVTPPTTTHTGGSTGSTTPTHTTTSSAPPPGTGTTSGGG